MWRCTITMKHYAFLTCVRKPKQLLKTLKSAKINLFSQEMICQKLVSAVFCTLILGKVDAEIVAKKEVITFDISNVLLRLNAPNMSTL